MINEDNNSVSSEGNDNEDYARSDEDVMQILVASDINLGYERTVKREEDDSFRTFEEILQYAKDNNVDAVFIAGNLFYEPNPPLSVLTKCVHLLRTYCLSHKPVKIKCLTDPGWVFNHYASHKTVNFDDQNLNIGIPIFAIYGHRDSPTFDSAGALDLLAATGLINYFGKWAVDPRISIPPLLLRKGSTTVALYGLNHMNDETLSTLIKRDKFELLQDDTFNAYNVMILHQTRKLRSESAKRFVVEALLPDFLNLVIWGHETKSHFELETVPDKKYNVYQLGSTIPTALLEKDEKPKKVAILKVYQNELLEIINLQLQTVRPFMFKQLKLDEHSNTIKKLEERFEGPVSKVKSRAVESFVDEYIKQVLIPEACKKQSGHSKQPQKPLLRLKICYDEDHERFDLLRLRKKYQDIIANPENMIWFSKSIPQGSETESDHESDDECSEIFLKNNSKNWTRTVESGITEHFSSEDNKRKLTILSVEKLNKSLTSFMNGNRKIFEQTVRKEMKKAVNELLDNCEAD